MRLPTFTPTLTAEECDQSYADAVADLAHHTWSLERMSKAQLDHVAMTATRFLATPALHERMARVRRAALCRLRCTAAGRDVCDETFPF